MKTTAGMHTRDRTWREHKKLSGEHKTPTGTENPKQGTVQTKEGIANTPHQGKINTGARGTDNTKEHKTFSREAKPPGTKITNQGTENLQSIENKREIFRKIAK